MEIETKPTEASDKNDLKGKWNLICEKLAQYLSADTLQRWFQSAQLMEIGEKKALIEVGSDMQQIWIETNYVNELRTAIFEVLGVRLAPELAVNGEAKVVEVEKREAARQMSPRASGAVKVVTPAAPVKGGEFKMKLKRLGLNPDFDFESFVVGDNSQFAHAACSAVASREGRSFNPLFIHGQSGLGKTHLMTAVAQELLLNHPEAKVVFLTAEHFANEFIEAVRKGNLDEFRKAYRHADAMLIDDIQFLAGKERTQDEFFHTFNALLNSQTQLILTCDRPALEIQTLEPRLVSRFESGLTVELQPPGFETRVAILKRKMEQWKVELDYQVVVHVANLIKSNVRRLEGALTRVASYSFLSTEPMTVEVVDRLLRDLVRDEATNLITIEQIQRVVADHYGIALGEMRSRRRPASIAFPRQVAMALARKLTSFSLVEIGTGFGKRDHGTVIHACKKVEERMGESAEVRATVEKLTNCLQRPF